MSARERLIRSVYNKLSQNQMEALVDDYAHELAEQVRAGHPDRCPDFADGAEWGADFIDPEVSE